MVEVDLRENLVVNLGLGPLQISHVQFFYVHLCNGRILGIPYPIKDLKCFPYFIFCILCVGLKIDPRLKPKYLKVANTNLPFSP